VWYFSWEPHRFPDARPDAHPDTSPLPRTRCRSCNPLLWL